MRSDSIDWGDYVGFDPGVDGLLDEASRAEARGYFRRFMEQRPARHDALRALLERNGETLEAGDRGLDLLNDWFSAHVEGDRDTQRLDSWWYVVVRDIGIWVGDELIRRAPQLEWRLFTAGRRNVSYQRPAVMGFSTPDKNYNVDPERLVSALGVRALLSQPDPGYLRLVVDRAVEIHRRGPLMAHPVVPLLVFIDRELEAVRVLVDAVRQLSARTGIDLGFELDGGSVGWIEAGTITDALRIGLLETRTSD